MQTFLRKYGVQTTIHFVLYEVDGVDLRVDAVDAGADCSIMKDEGAETTCVSDFADEGTGYSLIISATEMEAAEIMVYIVDSATKVWLDEALKIETYGHASAMHAMDLDTTVPTVGEIQAEMEENAASILDSISDLLPGSTIAAASDIPAMVGTDNAALATGLATHDGKLDTLDTVADGIQTDLSNVTDGLGALKALIDAVKTVADAVQAKTDNLPVDPADDSNIDAQLATIAGYLDTEIAAIITHLTDIKGAGWTDENITTMDALIDAIKAKTDDQPAGVPKNAALSNFMFLMMDSSDHITPKTGLTITEEISKDGGAFAPMTNTFAEVSGGMYKINITQAERNADIATLKFTAAGADDRFITIISSK